MQQSENFQMSHEASNFFRVDAAILPAPARQSRSIVQGEQLATSRRIRSREKGRTNFGWFNRKISERFTLSARRADQSPVPGSTFAFTLNAISTGETTSQRIRLSAPPCTSLCSSLQSTPPTPFSTFLFSRCRSRLNIRQSKCYLLLSTRDQLPLHFASFHPPHLVARRGSNNSPRRRVLHGIFLLSPCVSPHCRSLSPVNIMLSTNSVITDKIASWWIPCAVQRILPFEGSRR